MKKSLIALAALAATSAFAQSTVTLSGLVDLAFRNQSKVAPGLANNNLFAGNNNRLIFSATEDLGGGMRALVNLQMRFDATTGNRESSDTRPLFQGESRVGISGGFGTIMLGRGLSALQAANGPNSDPWGVTTVAGSLYNVGFATDYAAGGEGRIDQAIFYTSPRINNLTLSASYSPRELSTVAASNAGTTLASSDAVSDKTHYALNLLYAAGPLVLGAGQEQNRVGDKMTQLYGNYDLGPVRLFASTAKIKGGRAADRQGVIWAATSQTVNSGLMGSAAVGTASGTPAGTQAGVAAGGSIDNHSIGAIIPMGATSFRVGYSIWNGNGAAGQKDDTKIGLGVRHNLSKRTYVYSDIASQTRKNNTGARPDRDNSTIRSFDLGISHSF